MGRVAQATAPIRIYAAPSTKSRVYYNLLSEEYLVVQDFDSKSSFKKVLLQNMQYGYALTENMSIQPYEYKVPSRKAYKGGVKPSIAQIAQSHLGEHVGELEFVRKVFAEDGKTLPSILDKQIKIGVPIKRLEDLKSGDRLYFWDARKDRLGSAGVYVGNGYFIHPGDSGVMTDYLGDKKFLKQLVAARR